MMCADKCPKNVRGAGSQFCTAELNFFNAALSRFQEVDSVTGSIDDASPGTLSGSGLGPCFNMNSCSGCHAQPAIGGTSPFNNPEVAVATLDGAQNTVPSFITLHGPVREAHSSRTLMVRPMAASMIFSSSPAATTRRVATSPNRIMSRRSSRTTLSFAFRPRSSAPGRSRTRPTSASRTMLRRSPVSARPMASQVTSIIAPTMARSCALAGKRKTSRC